MALVSMLMLAAALATIAAPDWTDCPNPCRCKWTSGKKTAVCKQAAFTNIPAGLDAEMQVLDLSDNFLTNLPKEMFKNAGLLNLQRVFLSNTALKTIHKDAFRDLIILVEIDLSHNQITSLDPGTFYGNERLRILYLNGNPLRILVEAQFPILPHLRILELDGCQLVSVHRNSFIHLTALETLSLKHNLLQNLSETAFMNFAHLKTLVLDGNPWRCDCELRGFRDWFLSSKLHSVSLTCVEPARLLDRLWENVPSEEFACSPQIALSPDSQEVQAEAGGNVTFGCHVLGDPEPKVSWLYEGYPVNHTWLVIEAEEGLLDKWANISVYNVSESDTGIYTCVAKNILSTVALNVTLVLPEVVTATTVSKSEAKLVWWGLVIISATIGSVLVTIVAVCYIRSRNRHHRRNIKASVSFTDQEKKLLDVSIATSTTDRGTGSCEALGPELELEPVHITIEREPTMAVYPPPPEFSGSILPAYGGNIFISVSVSRDPMVDPSRCPDLLDLPHRAKPMMSYHATLPRRLPPYAAIPHYDNMGPRVTAGGSSTLSLPGAVDLPPPPPPLPPPPCMSPEFVSL